MGQKLKGLIITILVCLFPIILIGAFALVLVFLPLWSTVQVLAKVFRPEWEPVTHPFEITLAQEKALEPDVFNICSYHIIDGHLSTKFIRQMAEENVLRLQNEKGQLVYSRLRKTIAQFLGYPFWKVEDRFDLNNHIRDYDYDGDLALPSPSSENNFRELLGKLALLTWKKNMPRWEILVVHNNNSYLSTHSKPQTVLLGRWHHSIMDGYSYLYLLQTMLKGTFTFPKPATSSTSMRVSTIRRFFQTLSAIIKIPSDLAGTMYDGFDATDLFRAKGYYGREYHSTVSEPIEDEAVQRIRKKYGVAYVSVMGAIFAGAVKRVFDEAGQPFPDSIANYMIFPAPGHPLFPANHFDFRPVPLPLKSESRVHRVLAIDANVRKSKQRWALTPYIVLPIQFLPTSWADKIFNRGILRGGSISISVFVSQGSSSLAGYDVTDAAATYTQLRTRLGASCLCYGIPNRLRLSLMVNKDVIRSEKAMSKFNDFVREETEALLVKD